MTMSSALKKLSNNFSMKALKIFSRDLFFFIAVFGFCLVGFYYAFAYTEAPPGTPPACPAGYPGCDAPINVGTTPQIKKGNLNVGDGSWLSITPYLNATYFGGYGAQKINARASAFSAVAGANPGKSFSLIMLAWNGTTNNLDTFCQNLINSSWHAQVVVKGNYFNQSFNNSDFWSYSTAITSQAEFDTYRSTGTQWWVGCSVLPAWSKNVGGYWQDGGSGKIYYNSGNVGIGTTAPGAKLELRGANIINTDALRISNASGNVVTGNVIGDIQFYGNDASQWGTGKVAEIQAVAFNDWTGGGRHTDLTFLTNSGGDVNPTEKVRITNAGNVGIGTVSPSYKLDVSGNGRFTQPVIIGTPTANTGSQAVNVDYLNTRLSGGTGGTVNAHECTADGTCETKNIAATGNLTVSGSAQAAKFDGAYTPRYQTWASQSTGAGGAAIYNDNGSYDALMVVGNDQGLGYNRWVRVWDSLWVNTRMDAPIYYDSSNTGYYVDPASTSNLNAANFAGNVGISGNATAGRLISTGRADVGNSSSDYLPNSSNWQYNLLLNAKDNSSIGFHDSGASVSSIRYSNSGFTIGANDGWGVKSVSFPGGVCLGGTCKTDWSQVTGGIVEEADPTVPEAVKAITDIEIGNWSAVFDRVAGSGDDWDTAFGWGDHDSQNYLKEGSIVNELTINKLNVTTIDPVYEIDGEKYATYVADFAGGVRIETSGVLQALDKKEIDFKDLEKGGDLWLFWQASNKSVNDLVVILTPGFNGKAWYEKQDNKIIIFSDQKGEVSYRLSLPRKDASEWPNKIEK